MSNSYKPKRGYIDTIGIVHDKENLRDMLNNMKSYSTNETKVGTWIDGKPIYRKVVSGQVSTANTWTTIATISDINTLIDVKGTVGGYLPIPVYISSSYNVAVQKYNNEIQVRTNGYTDSDVVLAIEYTKTTD